MTFIGHIFGLDNASGPWYLWWSGIAGDITIFTAAYAIARKHNCHHPWCFRVGRFPVSASGMCYCRRHHPDDNPGSLDAG